MSSKKRYGNFTGVYGALAALAAYSLSQLGIIPKTDIPFIIEAGSAVLGGLGGLFHAWITDNDGVQQAKDQK